MKLTFANLIQELYETVQEIPVAIPASFPDESKALFLHYDY